MYLCPKGLWLIGPKQSRIETDYQDHLSLHPSKQQAVIGSIGERLRSAINVSSFPKLILYWQLTPKAEIPQLSDMRM